jgi:AraC-like DNA-binding protein
VVQTAVRLAVGRGFALDDLRILEDSRSWSESAGAPEHRIVFGRRGLFRLRGPRWRGVVDPLVAYVRPPGAEQLISHRPRVEDACTVVWLDEAALAELTDRPPPDGPVHTNGRLDLAHRMVLARARSGTDAFELTERVLRLVADLLASVGDEPRRSSTPAHRHLAESARELLATDPARPTLDGLAQELGVSRSHLSRVFRAESGETLTRYRNRLRVRAALDRLEAGATDLAEVAADLGFADHAHLTRNMRAEVGDPPDRVRALIRSGRDHRSSSRSATRGRR